MDVREAIAGERREMADLLDGLPAEAWDSPTLCAGWRVREVVAHTTMPFRYSIPRVAYELLAARGNINRMADRCARRDAAVLSADELAATLRDKAGHPWKPPGGGFEGALAHDVIHGLDITVGLGLDRQVPKDRLRIVLDGVTPKNLKFFGVDLAGIELRATDLHWSLGSGTPVTGAAQDLLLVLTGRKVPAGRLSGEPVHRFTQDPPSGAGSDRG
jgi:uncharacterized protein (TIGR03083 family)